jgi:peptidoglycan/xylan/chitin deacetylase (PgdA/CDA1 family)
MRTQAHGSSARRWMDVAMSGVAPLARRLSRRRLAVLAFHDVPPESNFPSQLELLARTYHPVSVHDVLSTLRGASDLPDNAVLITFDDGDPTVLEHAAPLLQAQGIPAVAYVVTGFIGTDLAPWWIEASELAAHTSVPAAQLVRDLKTIPDEARLRRLDQLRNTAGGRVARRQLTADEVRQLQAMGVAIGNHSHTHPLLDQCENPKIEREIQQAHDQLSQLLGAPPRTIAYPNGNVDERVVAAARRLGYELGLLFDHRLGPWPPADPLLVSRVRVNATDSVARFSSSVSGVHPFVHRVRGRL